MSVKKIIFDTDPGIDDAMALLFLAHAPELELVGITTTLGNGLIEATTRNALYLRDRFNMRAPVARGADKPLVGEAAAPPTFVHGENALGDIELSAPAAGDGELHPLPAHRFMIETIRRQPHEITVIAVGRMTNLALALREAPDIAGLVKEIIIMGGAFGRHGHTGNVTPLAEANIIGDPLAAEEVLAAAWPVTMVGLDVTQKTIMSTAYLQDLVTQAGAIGQFIWDISRLYADFHQTLGLPDGFYVHDSSAVAYAIDPSMFSIEEGPVRVITEGFAIGHTIQSKPGAWGERRSQRICNDVDSVRLLALYRRVITAAATATAAHKAEA